MTKTQRQPEGGYHYKESTSRLHQNVSRSTVVAGNQYGQVRGKITAQRKTLRVLRATVGLKEAIYVWTSRLPIESPKQLIEQVRNGVDGTMFVDAANYFKLSRLDFGRILGMSPATTNRKSKEGEKLDPSASERLARIAIIDKEAQAVFNSSEKATKWLTQHHQYLGQAPIEFLDTEFGAAEVKKMLSAIAWGGAI